MIYLGEFTNMILPGRVYQHDILDFTIMILPVRVNQHDPTWLSLPTASITLSSSSWSLKTFLVGRWAIMVHIWSRGGGSENIGRTPEILWCKDFYWILSRRGGGGQYVDLELSRVLVQLNVYWILSIRGGDYRLDLELSRVLVQGRILDLIKEGGDYRLEFELSRVLVQGPI